MSDDVEASAGAGEPSRAGELRGERREPMSRVRRRIAEHLVEARSQQAIVTTVNEVDLSVVSELRARYNALFAGALGVMPFFLKAAAAALRQHPIVNARIDGADIVYHERCHIGVAVATERGVVVPVVRDVEHKSFRELEDSVATLAERARTRTLTHDDLAGGTFTISNGGVFGSLLSTPIINAPESAILGMHAVQDRPIAVDGAVAIRPMMYLALSYDHRLIDGHDAVQFLVAIKACLEDARRLLATSAA